MSILPSRFERVFCNMLCLAVVAGLALSIAAAGIEGPAAPAVATPVSTIAR